MTSEDKYYLLISALKDHKKLAVAFSGGVDSTLLLHSAVCALGTEKVVALHARSCLAGKANSNNNLNVFSDNFPKELKLEIIDFSPLKWPEFVKNTEKRCYLCKQKIFSTFQEEMKKHHCQILADGTNSDDLGEHRPGIKAARELGVISPLADVGLTKDDIRSLAKNNSLTNHNLPSNSCLATRIQVDSDITREKLKIIEEAELFLAALGVIGSRVRLMDNMSCLEVQSDDMTIVTDPDKRQAIVDYLADLGLLNPVLSLRGR